MFGALTSPRPVVGLTPSEFRKNDQKTVTGVERVDEEPAREEEQEHEGADHAERRDDRGECVRQCRAERPESI